MSDTPRTDRLAVKWTDVKSDTWYVPRIHVRTLERENQQIRTERDNLLLCWNGSLQDTFEMAGTMPTNRAEQSALNNQLRASLKRCAVALKEAQFMLDIAFNMPFMPVQAAQEGSPKDLVDSALADPLVVEILKEKE